MPGSLQNRFQRHEEKPPPAVWDKISRHLDEEFNASDSQLSMKLENAEATPPPGILNGILSALHDKTNVAALTGKATPVLIRRIAAAAAVIVVIALAALYFIPSQTPQPALSNVVPATTDENPPQKADSPATTYTPSASTPAARQTLKTRSPLPVRRSLSYAAAGRHAGVVQHEQISSTSLLETSPYTLETVIEEEYIAVSAPPIRDADGNIIMDMRLISDPGDPYITITSPNGNPTRISSKFLKCLSYINNLSAADGDRQAMECKERFDQWRSKLLTEAAFVPAANNFFDIFELKELLED